MTNLTIRVFKDGEAEPDTTIRIPANILRIASKLIPKRAVASLQEKEIDVNEIIELSENPEARGVLVVEGIGRRLARRRR